MEPVAPTSGDPPDWPVALADLQRVRNWITDALPGRPRVAGPIRIYQATPQAVTAQFAVGSAAHAWERVARGYGAAHTANQSQLAGDEQPEGIVDARETVVFKATALDLFGSAPRVYQALNEHCAGAAPQLYAALRRGGQTWMLFQTAQGQPVEDSIESLSALARTLARIQTTLASLPSATLSGIPRTSVAELPRAFEAALAYIEEKHRSCWRDQDGPRADLMPLLPDALRRAATYKGHIERWAAELAAGAWRESLDHPDLHLGNAALQPNGHILIYDWEEATVGCPYFSMDQLLEDVRALDRRRASERAAAATSGASPSGGAGLVWEAWEPIVRRSYLDEAPWGTDSQRSRAFALAMALLPVKKASEYIQTDQKLRRIEGNRHLSAVLLDALDRWENLALSW